MRFLPQEPVACLCGESDLDTQTYPYGVLQIHATLSVFKRSHQISHIQPYGVCVHPENSPRKQLMIQEIHLLLPCLPRSEYKHRRARPHMCTPESAPAILFVSLLSYYFLSSLFFFLLFPFLAYICLTRIVHLM